MWQDLGGHNLLSLMYQDSKRWSFLFQSYVQLTQLRSHLNVHPFKKPIKIMERSIHSSKYCFMETMLKMNLIQPSENEVFSAWYNFLVSSNNISVDLIIYLQTSPEIVYERILKRELSAS